MRGVQQAVDGMGAPRRPAVDPKPCAGTGPGTIQYDACHAAEFEVILQLRAEIETLRAQLAEAKAKIARAEEVLGWAGGTAAGLVAAAHNARAERDAERAAREQAENKLAGALHALDDMRKVLERAERERNEARERLANFQMLLALSEAALRETEGS